MKKILGKLIVLVVLVLVIVLINWLSQLKSK